MKREGHTQKAKKKSIKSPVNQCLTPKTSFPPSQRC